eukprot:CAMPEP_0118648210 /NCGR_PEP_ID=MMETSP0785-20121206/9031_1 /TAXON_ID=91992 /ORGANISM="Bolidomonas pacifica, Strain CCMP 1866" /LENGTH=398 /DNA_ID=CAMNT_0006540381 /DNA_START=7 /DNA_END=1199 /DNA_ORIENTATION=+
MGKTSKSKKRAIKEARIIEEAAVSSSIGNPSDADASDLFVVDTTGASFKKRKLLKIDDEAQVGGKRSVMDKKAEKISRGKTTKQLKKMVQEGKKKLTVTKKRALKVKEDVRDLWSVEEEERDLAMKKKSVVNRQGMVPGLNKTEILRPELTYRDDKDRRKRGKIDSKRGKVLAVAPPRSGQSYNPDFKSHQSMLGVAVSAEMRRNELVEWEKKPLGEGMSDETLAILKSDSESDSESDDEDDDGEVGRVGKVVKREGKKTRADRNRQRRHKDKMLAIAARKKEKALLNEVTEVKMHKRKLLTEVKKKEERKAIVNKMKEEKRNEIGGYDLEEKAAQANPKRGPTVPVATTDELGGGMRRLVGKGGGMQDTLLRMEAQGKVQGKSVKERRRKQGKVKRR